MYEVRGLVPLLQVFDMPKALAFYRDVIGFTVERSSSPGDDADWVLLSLAGFELMLNTAYESHARPPAPDSARQAAHGDTALYFGTPDVAGVFEQLRARGAVLEPPSRTGYGFLAISLMDPDGYSLVFHWPAD
jgi:glyoxylase I family protein